MAEGELAYRQVLKKEKSTYTFELSPLRGKKSFEPINMNGSQRGWRPIVHFFDQRITEIKILEGTEWNPVITDDFIMIPNPKTCDPKKEYKVIFEATPQS
jgi:zinc protease